MKILLLSSCLLTLKVFALEDFKDIIHNYDIDCVEESVQTPAGNLKSIVCLDKKFQKNSKIYLNKKLILEKPFPVRIMNVHLHMTKNFHLLVSDPLPVDINLENKETKLYLLNTYDGDIKFYEFGVSNCEFYNNNRLRDWPESYQQFELEVDNVTFHFENGKYSFSIDRKEQEESNSPSDCANDYLKNKKDDINEFIKPYVNEIPINKNDPLITDKKEYSIYEKVDTDLKTNVFAQEIRDIQPQRLKIEEDEEEVEEEFSPEDFVYDENRHGPHSIEYFTVNIENKMNITKKIKTPLGEVRFYQGVRNKVTLFDGKKEKLLLLSKLNTISLTPQDSNVYYFQKFPLSTVEHVPGYWDPGGNIVIPGILYINEGKTLIVGYNMAVSRNNVHCGTEMFILDLSKNEPLLTTFGGYKVCSIIKNVQFNNSDKAKILINPNLEFNYEDGKITLPSEQNYEIIQNSETIEIPNKTNDGIELSQSVQNKHNYQFFPPYAQKEKLPYSIYNRNVFTTKQNVFIDYFNEDVNKISLIRNQNFEHKLRGSRIEIKNIDLNRNFYLINVFKEDKCLKANFEEDECLKSIFKEKECLKSILFLDNSLKNSKLYMINNNKNECLSSLHEYNENSVTIHTNSIKKEFFKYFDGKFIIPKNSSDYDLKCLN